MKRNRNITPSILSAYFNDWSKGADIIAHEVGTTPNYVHFALNQRGLYAGFKPPQSAIDEWRAAQPVQQSPVAKPAPPKPVTTCNRMWVESGKLARCETETRRGETYCEPCRMHLITCLDRPTPAPAAA